LNLKFSWKWLVVIALVIAISIGGFAYYKWVNRIIPEELIKETLAKSLQAKNYRYDVCFELVVNGSSRVLSDVKGEKAGDNFHFKGKMLKQEVEVYQVDETIFMKDTLSGRWMERRGTNVLDNEYFLTEINPLSSFEFTRISNLQYHGLVEEEDGSFYLLEFIPTVNNKMLNKFWKDFTYKIWVDKRSRRISKAEIVAAHKSDSQDKMMMRIKLYDYNKDIEITSPKEEE